MRSAAPFAKQVLILAEAKGDVVARHTVLGNIVGEFFQISSGEIYFRYLGDTSRRWYVNRSMSSFRDAAAIFNRCCEQHAQDENTEDDAAWAEIVAQLRSELVKIEALGNPEMSLWSATIHDAEGGLLTLY